MTKNKHNLPDGWQWVKLGDVCEIINGSTPKSTIDEYWNGDIVWITPTDLGQLSTPIIKDSLRKITEKGYKSCNTNIVPKGSIIFSCRAPIGHIGIADVSLCTNQGCKSFVLKENIDQWFLYYYIKESVPELQSLGSGATFKEISKSKLATFPIVLPPIDEQKRIASILNEQMSAVERARKATEAQLESALALPSAYLRSHFHSEEAKSWRRLKIKDVADIIVPTRDKPKRFCGNIPWVTLPDVKSFYITDARYYLTEQDAQEVGNRLMPPQTVLLSCAGSIGKVAITTREIYANQQFYGLVAKEYLLDHVFLARYLQLLGDAFYQHLAGKSVVSFFSKDKALNIDIAIPSLERQREIAIELNEKMRECEKLKQALQEQLETVNQLPSALLRRAFRGEL